MFAVQLCKRSRVRICRVRCAERRKEIGIAADVELRNRATEKYGISERVGSLDVPDCEVLLRELAMLLNNAFIIEPFKPLCQACHGFVGSLNHRMQIMCRH